jgi:hypothetical protein
VKLNGAVSHEVHISAVAMCGVGVAADMLLILDAVEGENISIELRQARNIFGAEVHVMEVEFHGCSFEL